MKKGFATSAILYTMLLLFLVLMIGILNNLQNKKVILDALKQDTIYALEQDTVLDAILDQMGVMQNKITELESQVESLRGSEKKGGIVENSGIIQSSTTTSYTGLSVEIPANSYFCLTAKAIYAYSIPKMVVIASSQSSLDYDTMKSASSTMASAAIATTYCDYTSTKTLYYVWAQYGSVGSNEIQVRGFYIPRD